MNLYPSKASRRSSWQTVVSVIVVGLVCLTWGTNASHHGTAAATATTTATTTVASTSTTPVTATHALMYQADKTFSHIAAGKLTQSLGHQMVDTVYRTPKAHLHRQFLRLRFSACRPESRPRSCSPGTLEHVLRVGLAGGIAGATGTMTLFPVDCAKTLLRGW